MSIGDVFAGLFRASTEKNNIIIQNIRLPRAIGGLIAGIALGATGLIMQTNLNNDMASPGTLGVSNAAVLGANIAIIILNGGIVETNNGNNFTITNYYFVTFFAFIFSLLAIFIVLLLSNVRTFNTNTVILIGVGLSSIFTAITTLIQYFAVDVKLSAAVYWSFGDLSRVTMKDNLFLAIIVVLAFVFLMFLTPKYNAMLGGDDISLSLGVKVKTIRVVSLIVSSLVTAAVVSFFGVIGFVGIMAPHITKRIIGNDHRFLLPGSAIIGILLIEFADIISRLIMSGTSLPVGAVTAILGAPFFIFIVFTRSNKNYA